MIEPLPLDNIAKKKSTLFYLGTFAYRLGSALEIIIVFVAWGLVFINISDLKGFSHQEILTYVLIGSLIGLTTNHLLHRIVINAISRNSFALLMDRPMQYLKKIIIKGFGASIFPFILSVGVHTALLYFFIDSFFVNTDIFYLAVIVVMIVLAFFTELLILYFMHLFVLWSIESSDAYNFILRLKKIFAGNYFPLSILPVMFVNVSLALPFAYSFFVPAELYLKKIELAVGLRGIGVQVVWILALYVTIKFVWTRKINKEKM